MVVHVLLIALRFVGIALTGAGIFLLAREQRVTVLRGLPARPGHIVGCVATMLGGVAISVLAIVLAG